MNLKLITISIFMFVATLSFAQTEKQFLRAGNIAFENSEYYEAIAYFENALKFNKNNSNAIYRTAMSYYNLKDYENAAKYFKKTNDIHEYPLLDFYAATNQKALGNYEEAIALFQSFNNYYPIQGYFKAKSEQEIASCYWALDQKINEEQEITQLAKPLNTGYSDFGATYLTENIIQVTSLQSITKNLKSDFKAGVFAFDKNENKFTENEDFDFPISKDSLDYANGFYLAEKNEFYYTECYTEHELGEKVCDIYVRKYKDNTWGNATKLNINIYEYTETQPQLSINENGESVLFFTSDRPGGKGKLDIWMAKEISFGNFEAPINLPSTINTIDNESTPYFDQEKQSLYFSSEWHYGFGGYDIFESKLDNNKWQAPTNLGEPINSSANDQYFYPTPYESVLFSSNREGAMQLKGAACCFDIFEYTIPNTTTEKDSNHLIATNDLENNIENNFNANSKLNNPLTPIEYKIKQLTESLPATVYFHNDEPNPKSTATKTTLTYQQSYDSYKNVSPLYFATFDDETAVKNWFNNVDKAYQELNEFLEILAEILPEQKMTLTIEGYCSPLALNDYNINLAKRRIVNLENYILKWNNAQLKPYFDSGDLKFEDAPFGEEKANQQISDSVDNTKESIFNPKAAQERRVSIIAVKVN